jgi:hypothetical protein
MSEESKKIEKIEQEAKQDVKEVKPTELSEQELDNVAGGAANDVKGIDIIVKPPPYLQNKTK